MEELYRFKNRKEYAKALDMVILKKDIQERGVGDGKPKHRYFPIPIKEAIADYMFSYWNIIDEKYVEMNGMLVSTIKMVFVPDYSGSDELFCTGSAAVMIQDKKNALEYQLPAVRSEAIGNALGSLGNIFGRNLSRVLKTGINIDDSFTLRQDKPKKKTEIEPEKPKQPKPPEPKKPEEEIDIPF